MPGRWWLAGLLRAAWHCCCSRQPARGQMRWLHASSRCASQAWCHLALAVGHGRQHVALLRLSLLAHVDQAPAGRGGLHSARLVAGFSPCPAACLLAWPQADKDLDRRFRERAGAVLSAAGCCSRCADRSCHAQPAACMSHGSCPSTADPGKPGLLPGALFCRASMGLWASGRLLCGGTWVEDAMKARRYVISRAPQKLGPCEALVRPRIGVALACAREGVGS